MARSLVPCAVLVLVLQGCAPSVVGSSGLVASSPVSAECAPAVPGMELVVQTGGGTFGDAVQQALLDPFQRACGVKVTRRDASRTPGQLIAMVEAGQAPFDVATTQGQVEYVTGVDRGIFYRLPSGFWDPVRADMEPGSITDHGTWCCPFARALLYSTKAFPTGVSGWQDFWDVARFPGPRSMVDNAINLHIALLADGVARDAVYPIDLDRAFRKLDEVAPYIRTYTVSDALPIQQLETGEVVMAVGSANRAVAAIREGASIGVSWQGAVFVKEGMWVMPRTARNVEAAMAFLRWVARAEAQIALANSMFLAGGNRGIADRLAPGVREQLVQSHLAEVSPLDARWWAANNDTAETRWRAWRARGR